MKMLTVTDKPQLKVEIDDDHIVPGKSKKRIRIFQMFLKFRIRKCCKMTKEPSIVWLEIQNHKN